MSWLTALLPGLWVLALAALLAWVLRRWFDPVPARCWAAWGIVLAVLLGAVLFAGRVMLPLGYLTKVPPFTGLAEGEPPGNMLQSDLVLQIAPWLVRVREAYAAGEWPLWNALSGAGEPLLANPQSQAFQPLAWLALPFPVAAGFGVIAALRVLLALVFTFLLLRRQGIAELPALAGSLAFGLSGFLQLSLGWPLAGSATFLPVVLYGLVLVDQRGARRDSLLLAFATAAVLLVGHPETGLHVTALAAAFALSRLVSRPAGRRLALMRSWAVAAGIGAALAAPVALPAAEYLPQSLRASILETRHERLRTGADAQAATPEGGSRQRGMAARLVPNAAPHVFGNNRFGAYWGERNINEDAAGFAGTAALLAALAGVWPLAAGRRFPQERLMWGATLACLVILARPPGLPWLFSVVPVIRESLSFHSRVSVLLDFTIAYTAACAWERWRQGEIRVRPNVLAGAALAALIAWAYLAHPGPAPGVLAGLRYGSLALQLASLAAAVLLQAGRFSSWRAWGLAAVVAVELLFFHAPANPPVTADLYYPQTPPIAFLHKRLDPWHRMAGLGPALRPNFASVYGFADPRSSNPAKPAAYVEATRRINAFPDRATDGFTAPEDPLYGLLGVRFLMTPPRQWLPAPYRLVSRRGGVWIHQNRRAQPFLFLPASAMACCMADVRDFGEQAVLRELPHPRWAAADPPASSLDLGEIRPAWLRARARLTEPRLLASSVYQDGNWKLLIGGKPSPTTLANGPFVAAWIPAGDAGIDLLYRPGSFVLGLAVAALGLAAGAVLWVPPPQTADRSQTHSSLSA
jgi:hypothetical protein